MLTSDGRVAIVPLTGLPAGPAMAAATGNKKLVAVGPVQALLDLEVPLPRWLVKSLPVRSLRANVHSTALTDVCGVENDVDAT